MPRTHVALVALGWMMGCAPLLAPAVAAADDRSPVEIDRLAVTGVIDGPNIRFTLSFNAQVHDDDREIPLIQGDVVLESLAAPPTGYTLRYEPGTQTYYMSFEDDRTYAVEASFAARPQRLGEGAWRAAAFHLPASQVRQLQVQCDRVDLEVRFPDAMRVESEVVDATKRVSAILGPGKPFVVQWKPQVQALDAKLVAGIDANIIAMVTASAVRVDQLMAVDIAQGRLTELRFAVPEALSVTQVRGRYIRDWSIDGAGEARTLTVTLNRAQSERYALQVVGETVLPPLPAAVGIPALRPLDGLRARGQVQVGTNSAIALVVEQAVGLSQIDNAAFARMVLTSDQHRDRPTGKAFTYAFTGMPFDIDLALNDIVPSYDASGQLILEVKEDDMIFSGSVEVDVRDAPVRALSIDVPARFNVAAVTGPMVADYRVRPTEAPAPAKRVEVQFKDPVIGHTLIGLRLELGRGPLDQTQTLRGIDVVGAKTQRGYLVLTAAGGVRIDDVVVDDPDVLKPVHTASVPMRIADAQMAYRFRDATWTLTLTAQRKAAGVRAELLHLASIGEGVVYGSVAASYFITGSPIDALHFVIPESLNNVEFVGGDIINWRQDPDHPERWTVKLGRKVIGDYNLAITHTQRYGEGRGPVAIGAVECRDVERQAGFVLVASQLNLRLQPAQPPDERGLLPIDRDEVPANYRLLAHAPILESYKYVGAPHRFDLDIALYDRGRLLPAVVEIMDMNTQLDVREDGQAQTITRVRYKVKNTSAQYLSVHLPTDARFRRVSQVPVDASGNELDPQWVAASTDQKTGALLIPLPRNVNPNEPTTLELEYAQAHAWSGLVGRIDLAAPRHTVPATFADWRIAAEGDWAVRPAGGTMALHEQTAAALDLPWVLHRVGVGWAKAVGQVVPSRGFLFAVPLLMLGVIAVALIHRAWVPDAVAVALLAALAWLAIVAGGRLMEGDLSSPPYNTAVQYTQAVNVDSSTPLAVAIEVVPRWREHATIWGVVVAPIIAAMGLAVWAVAGWRRPGTFRSVVRPAALAAAATAALYALAQFRPLALPLGHLLTWGVPAALVLAYAVGGLLAPLVRRAGPKPVAAAVLLGAVLFWPSQGCAEAVHAPQAPTGPIARHVNVDLTAERDSMAVDIELKVRVDDEARIPLVDEAAVLLSDDHPQRDVRIVRADGRYWIDLQRRGTYEVRASFLSPLAEPDADQRRAFTMAMPWALTNRVSLTVPHEGVDIDAPTAMQLRQQAGQGAVRATALFAPGEPVRFVWQPRARAHEHEQTVFYAQLTGLLRFDSGNVEGRHALQFQVAQGELSDIRVRVPDNMTVTAVHGEHVGAWRFEPSTHELEARLSQPVTGEYGLQVVTHMGVDDLPARRTIAPLQVLGARRQRGTIGFVTSPAVYLAIDRHPPTMNVDDFARDAESLIQAMTGAQSGVRHAYRIHTLDQAIDATVHRVQPELRAAEAATFTVADDRLVYNGTLDVEIAKAGLFSAELRLPEAYDIDALAGDAVSHWDESEVGEQRRVVVHFRQRTLGAVHLNLALSRAVTELPGRIAVPRIEVVDAVKHTGRIVISADRGVRLSVAERDGVSELRLDESVTRAAGPQAQPALAYKLLRPDWRLVIRTEVVEPLINVEFLHVADVSEGLIKHHHTLVYRIKNAGVKVLELRLPEDVLGLQVLGPQIARREQVAPGEWRVELAGKWYDRPYVLRLQYETQFDRDAGELALRPVVAGGVDQQRGYVVIDKADRMELATATVGASLQATDARAIGGFPGAPDIAGAAFAFRSTDPRYALTFHARRLDAARQLEATVLSAELATVVTMRGEALSRAQLRLRVGSKRNLATRLPDGAHLWSCTVNGRSVAPALRADAAGDPVLLVPLAQGAVGELPVDVDLIYVQRGSLPAWAGRRTFAGPRFDLPLRDVQWTMFVPEGFAYDDFEGTLTVNEQWLEQTRLHEYDVQAYDFNVRKLNQADYGKATELQQLGKELARQGRQYEARQALELGANYSQSDPALNEDIRVDLHNLLRQQAKVGLVGNRSRLRGAQLNPPVATVHVDEHISQQAVEQIEAQLDRADADNLEAITRRIIEVQEAAAGRTTQLVIDMPLRGRMLQFTRPLQITPNAEMSVRFDAEPRSRFVAAGAGGWSAGLFAVLAAALAALGGLGRHWSSLRRALAPESPSGSPVI